jgi:hypothetical protein
LSYLCTLNRKYLNLIYVRDHNFSEADGLDLFMTLFARGVLPLALGNFGLAYSLSGERLQSEFLCSVRREVVR